ncbi:MAG: hypothetical protein IJT73_01395 [Selenomonadaceae bacterium]|nr:hypothetical protein [Selenomonadaceae bacterium]
MFKNLWKNRAALVEKNLLIELNKNPALEKKLFDAMEYSLMSGGKKFCNFFVRKFDYFV